MPEVKHPGLAKGDEERKGRKRTGEQTSAC